MIYARYVHGMTRERFAAMLALMLPKTGKSRGPRQSSRCLHIALRALCVLMLMPRERVCRFKSAMLLFAAYGVESG